MSRLAFDKVGAVYVWIAIIVVFSIWVPDTFPNLTTAKQILNSNAITGLAALSVTIPLAARVFDLSFALNMTLCGVAVAHFVVDGVPLVLAVVLGVLIGLAVGLINATVVVGMKIDSFIATLATGSLIQALITLVTNDTPISDVKLAGGFAKIGQTTVTGTHPARLLLRRRRRRHLVPPRAHRHRSTPLRRRLQSRRRAAGWRQGRAGCSSSRS